MSGWRNYKKRLDQPAEASSLRFKSPGRSQKPVTLPKTPWDDKHLCSLCGLEDGACLCASFSPKPIKEGT
jgi:hypothetical protein